jgi:hypothetical protein
MQFPKSTQKKTNIERYSTMDKEAIVAIADGLKQIEDGVEKIQSVMREQNIKSIKDVAAELIPILKQNDDEINESIIKHLGE